MSHTARLFFAVLTALVVFINLCSPAFANGPCGKGKQTFYKCMSMTCKYRNYSGQTRKVWAGCVIGGGVLGQKVSGKWSTVCR